MAIIRPNAQNRPVNATQQNQVQIPDEIVQQGEQMTCSCGGKRFSPVSELIYISPILSPTGIQTMVDKFMGKACIQCGKLFNANNWLNKKNKRMEENAGS